MGKISFFWGIVISSLAWISFAILALIGLFHLYRGYVIVFLMIILTALEGE